MFLELGANVVLCESGLVGELVSRKWNVKHVMDEAVMRKSAGVMRDFEGTRSENSGVRSSSRVQDSEIKKSGV